MSGLYRQTGVGKRFAQPGLLKRGRSHREHQQPRCAARTPAIGAVTRHLQVRIRRRLRHGLTLLVLRHWRSDKKRLPLGHAKRLGQRVVRGARRAASCRLAKSVGLRQAYPPAARLAMLALPGPGYRIPPPIAALVRRAGARTTAGDEPPKLVPPPPPAMRFATALQPNQGLQPQAHASSRAVVLFRAARASQWHDPERSAGVTGSLAQHLLTNTTGVPMPPCWVAQLGSVAPKCARSPRAYPQYAQPLRP